MNKVNQGWIEAAKILAKNPKAKFKCPECNVGELMIKDEIMIDKNKMDRYLNCNHCGKWNVITMPIPSDNHPI